MCELFTNIMLQNELKSEVARWSPIFKPVFQQVICLNTKFWLDNFTRESLHTRDIRHLTMPQTFAKGR